MWKVEAWKKATRRWRLVGEADDFDKAQQAVRLLASKFGVARATKTDAKPDEVRLMRASSTGFWSSTGSGGLLG